MTSLATLRPLRDMIVIKRVAGPLPSAIIFAPEVAEKPSKRGEVVAVGPGRRNDKTGRIQPVDVKPGEVVSYQSSDKDDGEYVLIREGDILGVDR